MGKRTTELQCLSSVCFSTSNSGLAESPACQTRCGFCGYKINDIMAVKCGLRDNREFLIIQQAHDINLKEKTISIMCSFSTQWFEMVFELSCCRGFPMRLQTSLYYFSFPVYHQISLAHTFFSHRGLYLLFPTPKQCSNTVTVSWIQQAHRNNIKVKSPSPDTCAGFRFGSILLHIDNSSQNQMSLGMRISKNESYLSLVMHTCVIDNSK